MNQSPISTGCYGKRPVAADYIHHHRGGLGILDWQRWVQDGVDRASGRFGAALEPLLRDLGVFPFAFPSARSDVYLVGALGPGQDRSGRLFPFSVFAEVPSDPSGSVVELVFRHESVCRRAAEIVAAREVDLSELFLAVDRLGSDDPSSPTGEPTVAAYLARGTVGVLTSGDDGDRMSLSLARVTRNLRRVALQVDRDRRPPAYALRFPLPPESGRATAARMVFLEMAMRVLGPGSRPALFWTEAGRDGYLDLHPGPAGPAAFLALANPSAATDVVFTMDEDVGRADGDELSESAAKTCWADPGWRLQDAVDRCGVLPGRRRT